MEIVQRQANLLNRLVSDLLDSAMANGNFRLARTDVDLRSCVQESVDLYRNFSPIHQLKVNLPIAPLVCSADSLRIGQVINNLISNAIKYSPNGGDVIVRLYRENNFAVVEIEDKGMGISKEESERIYEPFRRSKITSETIPGVGLGLYTARRIVSSHKGQIEFKSKPSEGTTFYLRLPISIENTPQNRMALVTGPQ
jgi:signal transduction histidine kinase